MRNGRKIGLWVLGIQQPLLWLHSLSSPYTLTEALLVSIFARICWWWTWKFVLWSAKLQMFHDQSTTMFDTKLVKCSHLDPGDSNFYTMKQHREWVQHALSMQYTLVKEIIKCMPKVQAASLEMLLKITKKYQ